LIFTTDNLPKSLTTISGIFQVYVKVLVNATVKVAVVPNVNVGVADAKVPPLTGVNTKVGAVA
jgi:hypothetical protein